MQPVALAAPGGPSQGRYGYVVIEGFARDAVFAVQGIVVGDTSPGLGPHGEDVAQVEQLVRPASALVAFGEGCPLAFRVAWSAEAFSGFVWATSALIGI